MERQSRPPAVRRTVVRFVCQLAVVVLGLGTALAAAANTPPTITAPADVVVSRGASTGPRSFTIGDAETPASSLTLSGASSNPALVPNANISFGGSGTSRTVTVNPVGGLSGVATITITVTDGGDPVESASASFVVTVNDPPSISAIGNRIIDEDASTGSIDFTVSDTETPAGSLVVTATASSTNPNLLPGSANLVLGGSGEDRTINVIPAANENGSATITITVTDQAGRQDTESFNVTVRAVNDAPTITGELLGTSSSPILDTQTDVLLFTNITFDDVDQGRPGTETLTVTITQDAFTLRLGKFEGYDSGDIVFTGTPSSVTAQVRALKFDPEPNRAPVGESANFTVTLSVRDGSGATSSNNGQPRSVYVESANDDPQATASLVPASVPDSGESRPFRLLINDADPGDLSQPFQVAIEPVTDPGFSFGALIPASPAFTGTVAQVNTWLSDVIYRPVPNSVASSQSVTFRLRVTDVHGGWDTNDAALTIVGANDPPDIYGVSPNVLRLTDDPGQDFFPFAQVSIVDPDANSTQPQTVRLSVDDPSRGSLSATELSGTPAEVTEALRNVKFIPALRPGRVVGETVSAVLTIQVSDALNASASNNKTILAITSVDGAPIFVGVPDPEDQPLTLSPVAPVKPFQDLSVTDDVATADITVTISIDNPAKGRLTGLVGPGGSFVEVSEGSRQYRMTATPAEITEVISNLVFEVSADYVFPPSSPGGTRFRFEAVDGSLNTRVAELAIVLENAPRNHLVIDDSDAVYPETHPVEAERGKPLLGTLRRAVAEAGNNDVITFDLPSYPALIRLDSTLGPIELRRHVTFKGPGADLLVISGDSRGDRNPGTQTKIFRVLARATFEGLTLADGYAVTGGAISVEETGDLRMRYCAIVDSKATQWGGAIDVNGGRLEIDHCLFRGNVTDSSLGLGGGAICLFTTLDCAIRNSTFSANRQGGQNGFGGGGLYAEADDPSDFLPVLVEHCTFAENQDASSRGSAIVVNVMNTMVTTRNSVYADARGRNLGVQGTGQIVSGGGNVSDDSTRTILTQGGVPKSIILLDQTSDRAPGNPRLGAFDARNLRPVGGYPLLAGSDAVGRAQAPTPAIDQRGALRDLAPDAGAFELGASGRLVLNEIQHKDSPTDFLEFYVLRDSVPLDLSGFTVWVDGVRRHAFEDGTFIRPGAGIILADATSLPALGGTPVRKPIVAGIETNLFLGLRGTVEVRTPGSSGRVVVSASYVGLYADPDAPSLNLDTGNKSITLKPQYRGFAYVPHPDSDGSPGADSDGTPFGSSNAYPTATEDEVVVGEDDLVHIPVLDNDTDADGSDRLIVVDLSQQAGEYGNDTSISTYQLAAVSLDPATVPPGGTSIVYNPRASSWLQQLPEGVERTDFFYYSILDVGAGAIAQFRAMGASTTIVVSVNHRLLTGQAITITDSGQANYNATFDVTVLNDDEFAVAVSFVDDPEVKGTWETVFQTLGGAITDYAGTVGSAPITVTSPNHGLNNNEGIVISGSTGRVYDGLQVVTRVDDDHFTIPGNYSVNPAAKGSWTATRSRIPTRISQGLVKLTVIGANDPPTAVANEIPGEEETILRIFGDPDILAVSPVPTFDTDDDYAKTPVFASGALLPNDYDIDDDDDETTLRIVGVLSQVHPIAGYAGTVGETGVTVTSAGHGLANGDVVLISGCEGHPSFNGFHAVTVVDEDTFTIPVVFVDIESAAATGQWGILTDSTRLDAVSLHGAAVRLEIRVDRRETSIVYNPLVSEYLNGLALGETKSDVFFYAVSDSHGAVSFAPLTIVVAGRNDPPVPGIDPPSLGDLPEGDPADLLADGDVNFYLPPASGEPGRVDVEVTVNGTTVYLADLWTTDEETAIDIDTADLVANDTDVDRADMTSALLTVKALVTSTSRLGAALSLNTTTGLIRYNPSPALNYLVREEGVLDTFEVVVTDQRGSDVTALVAVLVVGLNDRPDANDDAATTTEELAVTVYPLTNDTDPDINGVAPDNQLRILPVPTFLSPRGASVTITPETLVYDPSASANLNRLTNGYPVVEEFPYTAADGSFIFANDDRFKVQADGSSMELLLLANDSNLTGSGGAIRIVSVGTPNRGGTVVINAAGDGVLYTPLVNFVGDEVFPYTISDENGNTDRGFVVVSATVNQLNGNLQANADSYSVAFGQSALLDVLANDNILPASGSALTITRLVTLPSTDQVELVDNQIRYTQTSPTAGYSVAFSYEISGGGIARAIATVEVQVVDRRNQLAVRPDSFSVAADSTDQPLNVLANDNILPGSPVVLKIARILEEPTRGTWKTNDTGTELFYTPAPGYVGRDGFRYEATDSLGGTGTGQVSLEIGALTTSIDFFSVPFDETTSTDEAALDVLANDRVLQATPQSLRIVSVTPASATIGSIRVSGDGSVLLFDPAQDQEGEATFTYTIRDGTSPERTAQGAVTVIVVRTGVLANPDFYSVEVNSSENVFPVLANDSAFPDRGRRLAVVSIGTGLDAPNRGGAVRLSETGDALIYTPASGFSGEETFTYSMTDSRGSDTAKVVVRVVSGALSANDDAYTVFFATSLGGETVSFTLPVLANDRVLPNAGQVLRITGVGINDSMGEPNAPDKQGEVALSEDGTSLVYTPRQTTGFPYHESFTYEITDGTARRAQGRVDVQVELRDDKINLQTRDDAFTVERDSSGNLLLVLANDDVRPASAAGWSITGVSPTAYEGVVVVRRTSLLYTPRPGFVGTDTFTYFVSDGVGGTGSATVRVKVGDLPLSPDFFSVLSGSSNNELDVLANDAIRPEVPGSSYRLVAISDLPDHGTAILSGDVVLYTPNVSGLYPQVDSFVYDVEDDSGIITSAKATVQIFEAGTDRDAAVVRVTVVGVNDAPIISGTRCCFEVYQRGSVQPFAGVTFTEYDDLPAPEILTLEIILSDQAHGYLTDGTAANLDPDNDGRYVFTGTAASLTTLIRSLTFIPTVGDPSRLTAGGSEETRFTLRLSDPFVTVVDNVTTVITRHPEIKRLLAPDGTSADEFGFSVGASRRTVTAGAPFDDDSTISGSGNKTGSAYVYERDAGGSGAWNPAAKVFPNVRAIGDEFGYATDVDASGTVMVAGARKAKTGSATTGAAYVLRRTSNGTGGWSWVETARLGAPTLASGDQFGRSVAINGAGDVAVIGAPMHTPAGSARTGAAFVFARSSASPETWTLVATLRPPSGANDDEFARSVSIQGNLIAVGAPRHSPTSKKSGATYLFRRNATGGWDFLVRIIPAAGDNGDEFGHSVAVHGTWLAAGARLDEAAGKKSGTTYVFEQSSTNPTNWTQRAMLQSFESAIDDEYGYAVAMDDQFLVVGARREATAGRRAGAIHVHGKNKGGAGAWGRLERLIPSTVDRDDEFGFSAAIRQGLVAVGARRQDATGKRSGSTYIYQLRFNNAPQAVGELPPVTAFVEAPFVYQVPVGIFTDGDVGDSIVGYQATLADGSPLPGWLAFNPTTARFESATVPSTLDLGTVLAIRVTAFDQDGAGVSVDFTLTVEAAPTFLARAVAKPSIALAWTLEQAGAVPIPPAAASAAVLGPAADPDGDGASNLEEYLRASNPFVAGDAPQAGWLTVEKDESGDLLVRVRRRVDDDRVNYLVESSADLKAWGSLRSSQVIGQHRVSKVVDDEVIRVPVAADPTARFFRLRMDYR